MRKIEEIIIHCSATRPDQHIGVEEIRKWHVEERGWLDCAYHYVIKRNGVIERGRDIGIAGAHTLGHNSKSIGICVIGGVDDHNNASANYTSAQWSSLHSLVDFLTITFEDAEVLGHNDLSKKDCPCFDVKQWWYDLEPTRTK